MKAYALPAADQPATFVELPEPQAPQGGLLIRVRAASVNGIDVFQSKGFLVRVMPHEFPSIIGRDFAPGDERVKLLSQELWERQFGAERSLVGRSIELDRLADDIWI